MNSSDLLYKDEVFEITGAAIHVHNTLGSGYLEAVYQEALAIELAARNIPFVEQPQLEIYYRGQVLKKYYQPDFVVFDKIIVEIKALDRLSGTEEAQVLNYLKATGMRLGLLINFGTHPKMQWKRLIK